MQEVFDGKVIGHLTVDSVLICDVDPTGVYLFKAKLADLNNDTPVKQHNIVFDHSKSEDDVKNMEKYLDDILML